MRKIFLIKGLPASGKTTWALDQIKKNPNTYKRVNKDDLRAMIDAGKYSKDAEKFILELRDEIIVAALTNGKHVIVDDTNLHPKHEEGVRELAKELPFDVQVVITDFTQVSKDVCIERDKGRKNPVGKKVINDMYYQFLYAEPEPREKIEGLPNAIIVDLDGTLALHNGRNPYDAAKCADDLLNPVVHGIMVDWKNRNPDNKILLVSGRSEEFRPQTKEFLKKHGIDHYTALHMREDGDFRKDYVIKKEIFENFIEGKYNIEFCLDDRNQTVEGWRELGLVCLQVANGDF